MSRGERVPLRLHHPGIEPGNVEERVEQLVHARQRSLNADDELLALCSAVASAELRDEQAKRVQRLAQIVRGGRQETRLSLVGEFKLMRALFDFLLKRGVGLLQSLRHAVELPAQRFQFIACIDRNALRKVAAADPRRTSLQRANRNDHPACEEKAG